MCPQSSRTVERAILDVFRYGNGWMLRRRGDPEPGVVLRTRERAIELGASWAARYADAELVIRDGRGNVDEVHRLGLIARRHSRHGRDEPTSLEMVSEVAASHGSEIAASPRGLAGNADAA